MASARTFLLILCMVTGSLFTLGAFDRRDARWSRLQCAGLAIVCYYGALVVFFSWGA